MSDISSQAPTGRLRRRASLRHELREMEEETSQAPSRLPSAGSEMQAITLIPLVLINPFLTLSVLFS